VAQRVLHYLSHSLTKKEWWNCYLSFDSDYVDVLLLVLLFYLL